ncbi:MAG: glycosyltransferase, partial [Cyclobacteriaceae bacterium]
MAQPLVSVICLCYNHAKYVEEAILSVLNQTYQPIELIVVDDASSDDSVAVIESLLIKYSQASFIGLKENIGNCAAFNLGFAQSKGQFIIDFAADDVLMPDRIEKGVRALESAGSDFGVQFSDALLIDRYGVTMGLQSDKFSHDSIPQGDIYREIIDRYFISAPTMLIRREVLEKLQGYDESLAYEDFDFWVRSSRDFEYLYIPEEIGRAS